MVVAAAGIDVELSEDRREAVTSSLMLELVDSFRVRVVVGEGLCTTFNVGYKLRSVRQLRGINRDEDVLVESQLGIGPQFIHAFDLLNLKGRFNE